MLCEVTSRDITTKDYPIPYVFTGSSRREETDVSEILDWLSFASMRQGLLKKPSFRRSLLPSFEIDLSSVYSQFESKIETYVTELLSEEDIVSGMLKQDFIVRMPPVKEYTVWVKVKSVEKATPRIVETEGF
jgi:hypothetical protein